MYGVLLELLDGIFFIDLFDVVKGGSLGVVN